MRFIVPLIFIIVVIVRALKAVAEQNAAARDDNSRDTGDSTGSNSGWQDWQQSPAAAPVQPRPSRVARTVTGARVAPPPPPPAGPQATMPVQADLRQVMQDSSESAFPTAGLPRPDSPHRPRVTRLDVSAPVQIRGRQQLRQGILASVVLERPRAFDV